MAEIIHFWAQIAPANKHVGNCVLKLGQGCQHAASQRKQHLSKPLQQFCSLVSSKNQLLVWLVHLCAGRKSLWGCFCRDKAMFWCWKEGLIFWLIARCPWESPYHHVQVMLVATRACVLWFAPSFGAYLFVWACLSSSSGGSPWLFSLIKKKCSKCFESTIEVWTFVDLFCGSQLWPQGFGFYIPSHELFASSWNAKRSQLYLNSLVCGSRT